jgi:O-methyltransferase
MLKVIVQAINYLFGGFLKRKKYFFGKSLDYLTRKRYIDKNYLDYIRLSTLELVSHEILSKNIPGNVAELGVYKGKFAKYINNYFSDKTLYLFDTFEGFDNRDKTTETKENFSGGDQDFSNTSVEKVLAIMPFPKQCRIVKGFFPESAKGIEDVFCFVSLDTDLYEPIYNGLVYFYPRLSKGGYIFIHDFNNDAYKGARKAVEQFCGENNVAFVPIPDLGGSAIIAR